MTANLPAHVGVMA